jgi:polysaccharide pyruvyl transferase WcaK-like protein
MQWKVHFRDLFYLNKAVLMGVGWWQYQDSPDKYSKVIWNQILNKEMLHSVRDSFTEKMLIKMGVTNVINTSCSTMWNLTPEHCREINNSKADSVIATLTNYNQDRDADLSFMNCLLDNYSNVYFWPQGTGDIHYFQSLLTSLKGDVKLLNPNLESLNKTFLAGNIDYIGTCLHAGIRSLQYKVRTIIIGIDNRAIEKSHDFNLTVLDRKKIDGLNSLININIKTEINLPIENINTCKSQFTQNASNLK